MENGEAPGRRTHREEGWNTFRDEAHEDGRCPASIIHLFIRRRPDFLAETAVYKRQNFQPYSCHLRNARSAKDVNIFEIPLR
ncbi:MAG: hypothetical protein M1422_00350 [Candidatus Thermoplasmatota archaeon]|jgi:hypothetical protein|nr:hypothetical protein [Candidatus Sysuiplasma jiujiangense]MBX8640584.1 hypothetical protein [Candidatus Sysuiplasma jiujiangense]MBX8641140.1 hypothetical protein [Candidatus Sysuiplasma jiujiangense]MCL4316711.1 hypothetical protein [Candidatus Thermoplasmatota archaeon]MCL5254179.1 hypothetical protein [Candidatus Thermoplasmatota archaeon]